MANKYIVNSLLYNDDLWNLRVVGKDDDLDIISLDFMNLRYDKNALISLLKSEKCILAPTVMIDAALLDDSDIVDALRYKSDDSVVRLRIVNEDYILTIEDYSKLSFADYIYVDKAEKFNYNLFKVFVSNGLYKHQFEKVFSDFDDEYKDVYHLDHKLNDGQLRKLVHDVNNSINAEIDLNMYDPSYYYEFVSKLNDFGLKEHVTINLLSNVLVDSRNIFGELREFKNNITITYSSNPEVINYYTEEPMANMVSYDNQLEINDHTDLSSYVSLLKVIDGGSEYIIEKAYSPLEAFIWTYKYIKENDIDTDPSNLFSAILRRCGGRVFRYSSLGENKNIFRIRDPKYGVDNIGIVDFNINIDEYRFSDDYSNYLYFPNLGTGYCNFIYSPRDLLKCNRYDETLSISNSLVLSEETYNKLKYKSCDNLELFYNINYDVRGNTFRFLELIGLKDRNEGVYEISDLYKYISVINKNGMTSNISDDVVFEALINVEKSINPSIDEDDINRIRECFDKANDIRDNEIFVKDYHIVGNYEVLDNGELVYEEKEIRVTPLKFKKTVDISDVEEKQMISVVEDVETMDEFITGTNIKRPRNIRNGETVEEYNAYYRDYFNKYLLPVINNNKDREEEFIINNKEDSEFVIVVDDDIYASSEDDEAIVVSKDVYDKHINDGEEVISVPVSKFAELNDHLIVIPYDKYSVYRNKKMDEDCIIVPKDAFDRYFNEEDEQGKVISREVYDNYMRSDDDTVLSKKVFIDDEKPIIVSMSEYYNYSDGDVIRVSKHDYDKYLDEHSAFIDYDDYDDYISESKGIIVSKEIYDMFASNDEEVISIPFEEYVKDDDNVILLSYNTYKNYKNRDTFSEEDYRIISDEIFKKYFGNNDNLVDAIVVSKEVYEKHGNTFKPMKKGSMYEKVDKEFLDILESMDKKIFGVKKKNQ